MFHAKSVCSDYLKPQGQSEAEPAPLLRPIAAGYFITKPDHQVFDRVEDFLL
jgi:hypothetical protein